MHLSGKELERVWLFALAEMARKRRDKGLKLNYPEAVAVICDEVMEAAREGCTLTEAAERGRSVLTVDDVMQGVAGLAKIVQVEAVFTDGTRLVTLHDPIGGGAERAKGQSAAPGQIVPAADDVVINARRPWRHLTVRNESERPIWVGSHFPLDKVNPGLVFDRTGARGWRLNVPAGQVTLFPAGEEKVVEIVPLYGASEASEGDEGAEGGDERVEAR